MKMLLFSQIMAVILLKQGRCSFFNVSVIQLFHSMIIIDIIYLKLLFKYKTNLNTNKIYAASQKQMKKKYFIVNNAI